MYETIIDFVINSNEFVWSYSNLKLFETCKYSWFLKYIKATTQYPQFFSDYGKFNHKIFQKFNEKILKKEELVPYFLSSLKENIIGVAPSNSLYIKYLSEAIRFLENISIEQNIVGVEKQLSFSIDEYQFTSFIDLITEEDDGLIITDYKSRILKPKSNRLKPTKSDIELDEFLKQLYMYAIAIIQNYKRPPKFLRFSCFRNNSVIEEEFDVSKMENTILWAKDIISKIKAEKNFKPDIDYFKCRYICSFSKECEYFNFSK